jgi:predicted dienelactone hydrolase
VRYDPFAAGPLLVGTRSGELVDRTRNDRALPFDVWYPDAEPGRRPLVLFSHTSGGDRRQSTFLCAHLASHGYVVAAADHTGNTAADAAGRAARAAAGQPFTPEQREAYIQRIIADRVPDLGFLLDQVLDGIAGGLAAWVDERRVGLVGWSFGGWAVLAAPEVDERFGAVVALAPAGNSKPLPGIIPATLTFAWRREVPTLILAAELDQYTPLEGQRELLARTPSEKRMLVLRGADHGHFGDQIEEPGGCPPEQAHAFTRGLALAHFDAALKVDEAAEAFLAGNVLAALRERGIEAALP